MESEQHVSSTSVCQLLHVYHLNPPTPSLWTHILHAPQARSLAVELAAVEPYARRWRQVTQQRRAARMAAAAARLGLPSWMGPGLAAHSTLPASSSVAGSRGHPPPVSKMPLQPRSPSRPLPPAYTALPLGQQGHAQHVAAARAAPSAIQPQALQPPLAPGPIGPSAPTATGGEFCCVWWTPAVPLTHWPSTGTAAARLLSLMALPVLR